MYSKTSYTGIVIKNVNEEGEENQEGEEEVDDRRKRRREEEVDDRRKRRREEEMSLFGSVSENELTEIEPEI